MTIHFFVLFDYNSTKAPIKKCIFFSTKARVAIFLLHVECCSF